jgi:peptide/nickel transport system substrate-binding protein
LIETRLATRLGPCRGPRRTGAVRRAALAAAAAAALLSLGGCGERPPATPADGPALPVRFPLPADPAALDAVRAVDTTSFAIARLVGDSLVAYDARLELVPRVARAWSWSDDHRVLTFSLRPGVRWHDGREVSAADVVHTWRLLTAPDAPPDKAVAFNLVESVEAPAPDTVVVRYRSPFAPALGAWTHPLLPAHRAEREPPLGCGPWLFVRWDPGERVVLRPNPGYYDGPPRAPELQLEVLRDYSTRFAALEAGRIDAAPLLPDTWRAVKDDPAFQARFEVREFRQLYFQYVAWRMDGSNPWFADARVRRAMTLAIDRAGYLEKVAPGFGRPAVTSIHPDQACFDPAVAPLPYDTERAAALLAEAGFRDGDGDGVIERGGRPFAFRLTISQTSRENERIAAFIQDQLRQVGVAVEIEPLEWAVFQERLRGGEYAAVMLGRGLDPDPDQYDLWHSSQATGGVNYAGLRDAEIDRWLEAARGTFDPDERTRLYRLLQGRLHELQPDTFFFYPVSRLAVSRQLSGLATSPLGVLGFWPGPYDWERRAALAAPATPR